MATLGVGSIVDHPKFGEGVLVSMDHDFYKIYFHEMEAAKDISRVFEGLEVKKATEASIPALEIRDIEDALDKVMERYIEPPRRMSLGSKWIGGHVDIKPGDSSLQSKEIPIDIFFSKIIMVRERLRVLEQNINNHEKLDSEEKLHLQQYITRAYGSLTTFNVLFANKSDQFKGTGK